MSTIPKFTAVVLMVAGAISLVSVVRASTAMAVEAVDISGKLEWKCEGDTKVRLDPETGILRIESKSAKVKMSLPIYGCHSSHCDWGFSQTASECGDAPCAEIIAGPKDQNLLIDLPGFERECSAEKSKELQN